MQQIRLDLLDLSGRILLSKTILGIKGTNNLQLDLPSRLPSAVYLLGVSADHLVKVIRLVKE